MDGVNVSEVTYVTKNIYWYGSNLFFLKILQEYSSYDLMRPMPGLTEDEHRCVIHEGPLRLLEKQGKV